jgi:hypothetical protein
VVPIAIGILKTDPLAGDMYEAQLLSSLNTIPQDFRLTHPAERNAMIEICKRALMISDLSDDVRRYVKSMAKNLGWDWSPRPV